MKKHTIHELRTRVLEGPPHDPHLLEALKSDTRAGAQALYKICLRQTRAAERETRRCDALLQHEREAWAQGFSRVAGVDEAGRGPLAGPLVAAAVILGEPPPGLNDSKQVTAARREILYNALMDSSHRVGIAIVEATEIDRGGIQQANYAAMLQAAQQLDPAPDFLLVDGFKIPGCPWPQLRLIKGDARSLSIAAASIIAKVTRDRIMEELDRQYPEYGFRRHKGYAAKAHLDALARYGPCPVHRRSFRPIAERRGPNDLFAFGAEDMP